MEMRRERSPALEGREDEGSRGGRETKARRRVDRPRSENPNLSLKARGDGWRGRENVKHETGIYLSREPCRESKHATPSTLAPHGSPFPCSSPLLSLSSPLTLFSVLLLFSPWGRSAPAVSVRALQVTFWPSYAPS